MADRFTYMIDKGLVPPLEEKTYSGSNPLFQYPTYANNLASSLSDLMFASAIIFVLSNV